MKVLGRVDLNLLVSQGYSTLDALGKIENVLFSKFSGSSFAGILFSNWQDKFLPAIWSRLVETIHGLGLSVYLETERPDFLKDDEALQTDSISGLVVRSATILPDGAKSDYFQMTGMHSTIKAFVSEACMRDFVVMAWETVDDDIILPNAIVRRSLKWCNFYSALCWIGSHSALYDATLNTKVFEPLSSFRWLKDANIMQVHDHWRLNTTVQRNAVRVAAWDTLCSIFPSLRDLLWSTERQRKTTDDLYTRLHDPPHRVTHIKPHESPLSISVTGQRYDSHGCFPLGCEVTSLAFVDILKTQQRLKSLGLLDIMPASSVQNIGTLLRQFYRSWSVSTQLIASIQELSDLAFNGSLRVTLGLESGLRRDVNTRFWAVYQTDSKGTEIFVSKNTPGLAGIVLHTFLSAKGYPRHICIEAEAALATWLGDLVDDTKLPRRLVQDVDALSQEERLILLQHMNMADLKNQLSKRICAYIRRQLINTPTFSQLKELNTIGYPNGSVSAEYLVETRVNWYKEQGCRFPSSSKCLTLFNEIDLVFNQILTERRENDLACLTSCLSDLIRRDHIDAYVDITALSVFCAARKGAFDEIYMEVADRNPLFSTQTDQAAAFAEAFALGSRCEAYFDASPSVVGKLLSDRFRNYYNKHPPPDWTNGAPQLATAYAGAQVDVDSHCKVRTMPGYQRFTFLSAFAIPALIDILLLTIIGRGLYLSTFMAYDEQQSATVAVMISLLLSGAIGTWIACGGPYYILSMAFSVANMFILIRLIAGIAFTVAAGLIGFITIASVKGPVAGIIFYLYLIALTTYFSTFASLASLSYPRSSFLSGRKVIFACTPILFIAPITTAFAGHDVVIYLVVLYSFLCCLLLGLRNIASRWVTWYQKIRRTDDSEIRQWYIATYGNGGEKNFENLSDPAFLKLSREALLNGVLAEAKGGFFGRSSSSELVVELARDWESTNFLLDWYCRYADIPRPVPFTSSWNIQVKVALETLRSFQKGLRLHNAFIHWRQSNSEIGCGILYFVIALLDKWIEILSGGHLVGLSASLSNSSRMAIGFGLAYYLVGAVLIDAKAQELHNLIGKQTPMPVKTAEDVSISQKREIRFKRKMYWTTLLKFLMWHTWSLAFSTALVWIFQASVEAMVMFFAYVLAYTGLLWYQYTKIFSGPHALKPLLIGVVVGLPLGIALKICIPGFRYPQVIGLGASTWTVAILSMWTAKMGIPRKVDSPAVPARTFHAYLAPWEDPKWSQHELQSFYKNMYRTAIESRLKLSPDTHPGIEVKDLLLSHKGEPRMEEAFPNSDDIVSMAIEEWEKGNIEIELVSPDLLGPGIRALSCGTESHLSLVIGVGRGLKKQIDIRANCQIIAEMLLQAVSQMIFKMPHEHAILAGSLVASGMTETMTQQLREEADMPVVMHWARKELLRQLCLGIECDAQWEQLPRDIRALLLDRCLGRPCRLTVTQRQWLEERLCRFDVQELDVHVARCNLGAATAINILAYSHYGTGETVARSPKATTDISYAPHKLPFAASLLKALFSYVYHGLGTVCKFIAVALVADPEFQRELDHVMKRRTSMLRVSINFLLNLVWCYAKAVQDTFLVFFLFHGRDNVKRLWNETKEMTIIIKKSRLVVQGVSGTFTAFWRIEPDGSLKVYYYIGQHRTEPDETKLLKYVCTYTTQLLLIIRQELNHGRLVNEYHYDYRIPTRNPKLVKGFVTRVPMVRRCVRGENNMQSVEFNRRGLIDAGSYMNDGRLVRFKYHYRKNPNFGDELLRAEFVFPHVTCSVAWCAPPLRHPERADRWIPHAKVTEATFVQGADVYECRWFYDHKFHPTIFTKLNGQSIQTPTMIEHDHLGVLTKPELTSFVCDNPIVYCDSLKSNVFTRSLGLTTKRFPVSTSRARSLMWKGWKDRADLDGAIVRWMDDRLLRRDRVLVPYWRSRDRGNLISAGKYLDLHADTIMASADLDDSISSWTPLAVKVSDLFNFGPGGDAVINTRSKDFGSDTMNTLHVMAADTGTWPNEGGGVSACRRDMVNSLRTIKWHMICESANDFGIPKHQTERNIQSLKVVPLWGLDFLTPTHGLFRNKLDSEVDDVTSASESDIEMNFIPILVALVKGARAVNLSKADIRQTTRALVNLNTYFQESRHWSQVWDSEIVKRSWRELWVTQTMPNTVPSSEWLQTELPTLASLGVALELWYRYLFIFSIPVPEKIPDVFQASHHSVSASYGVVCKMKRNCTLQIWDHAISWRETNLCLSSALSKLPPFVRNALLGLVRITSVLTLHHADIITPCADFFNPEWEVEIGTAQGAIEHRNIFRRKVDPVVNGIIDMQKFTPVKEIKTQRPTVTMLSHVWYAKDIKTALLAADIIINQWKFDDYHLDIYGAIDKAPMYSTECQEIIASKGLRGKVTLRGTADSMDVLERTWLFLNSSLSEGLPLALGEAALTGAPVVCTDVGASLRVLSDPDDFSRYSAVVAPNDAKALASAQISMLAMLGEWSQYAEDTEEAPVLTTSPTPEDVEKITRRMYEKTTQRRSLGMRTRKIVQKSFSGDRCLREHEQTLWIGKLMKLMATRPVAELARIATAVEQGSSSIEEADIVTALPGRSVD